MWWAGGSGLDLYLGTRHVVLCRGVEVVLSEPAYGLPAALGRAADALRGVTGRAAVRVWLSGDLCRPYLLPTSVATARADERLTVAAALASTRAGLTVECEVQIDFDRKGQSALAVAMPKSVLEAIFSAMSGKLRRVQSIRPWWAAVLEMSLQRSDVPVAVGVRDSDALTVLAGTQGVFTMAVTHSQVDDEGARLAWSRSVMGDAVPEGSHLLVGLRCNGSEEPLAGVPLGVLAAEETP